MEPFAALLGIPLARARDATSSGALEQLSQALARFYHNNRAYYEQAEKNDHSRYYEVLFPYLEELRGRDLGQRVRVLEIGAGKTAFPEWLSAKGARDWVEVTAQDISETNREWLEGRVDRMFFGDATEGVPGGPYDLIFCTFVFEHLVRPDRFLEACHEALAPGGIFAVFCPRYDLPGYVPPALRRLSKQKQLLWNVCLAWRHMQTTVLREPAFWIMTQPAALSGPFFRDADAVHMVSRRDTRLAMKGRGQPRPMRLAPRNLRDWFWSRMLLLSEGYQKN